MFFDLYFEIDRIKNIDYEDRSKIRYLRISTNLKKYEIFIIFKPYHNQNGQLSTLTCDVQVFG